MPDILEKSDEEFLQELAAQTAQATTEVEPTEDNTPDVSATEENTQPVESNTPAEENNANEEVNVEQTAVPSIGSTDEENANSESKTNEGQTESEETTSTIEDENFDYEAAYKQITAPFKANGKEVQLQSPEEVIQMMQMGANYTRKMQSIAPHRKVLMMLQNNDLLDDDKINFLIDLNRKDPAAIQKFLKDSGIDPLEVDVDSESTYVPGNHQVSNEEVALTSVLEDLKSTPEGRETIQLVSSSWDQASKDVLLQDPNILNVINEQRQNGIFQTITSEIERRKTIGSLPVDAPFLDAYRAVGMQIYGSGNANNAQQPVQQNAPVARTIPVQTNKQASNAAKVQATAPAKSVGKGNAKIDPLALSDEDFMKFMQAKV